MAIVSISRQIGSFGEEIAALVAEKLGYTLITGGEIYQLAQACEEEFKKECALFEREIIDGFWERLFLNKPANASLFLAVNYELAARNNVILMGRGSQICLKQIPWVLKVRIVAPKEIRAGRLSDSKGVPLEESEKYIMHHDSDRRVLIEQLYKTDPRDWYFYDLVINTAGIDPENAADLMVHAVHNMGPIADEAAWKKNLLNLSKAKFVECAIRKRVNPTPFSFINVDYSSLELLTIIGSVRDDEAKYKAEKIALSFDGVDRVDNQLIIASD